jgi:hypothetical protein
LTNIVLRTPLCAQLSTILLDTAGKQLMCEAVYLFGVSLKLFLEEFLHAPSAELHQ